MLGVFAAPAHAIADDVGLLCPTPVPFVEVSGTATFDLDGVSGVKLSKKGDAGKFRVINAGPTPVVRVDTVEAKPRTIACGRVDDKKVYQLTLDGGAPGPVRIRVYADALDEPPKWADRTAERKKALREKWAKGEPRLLMHTWLAPSLSAVKDAVAARGSEKSEDAERHARATLEREVKRARVPGCTTRDPETASADVNAFCDWESSSILTLAALKLQFENYVQGTERDVSGLVALQVAIGDLTKDDAHCKTVPELRWLALNTVYRLRLDVEVPLVEGERIAVVGYDEGEERITDVDTDGVRAVLIPDVPAGTPLSFHIGKGDRAGTPSLAKLLTTLFPLVRSGMGAGPSKNTERFYSLCFDDQTKVRIDDAIAPDVHRTSRTRIVRKLYEENTTKVTACAEASCDPAKSKLIKNQVVFSPDLGWEWTLMTTLAFSYGKDREPKFVETGAPTGPDRLFVVDDTRRAEERIGAAVLLGGTWRWCGHGFAVGAGPTLLHGGGQGPFRQWNLMLGFELTKGVYAMAGGAVRIVKVAADGFETGDVVAIPRDDDKAKVPTVRTRDRVTPEMFTVGIGLDLSVLDDAGASVLKAMGVTK